MCVVLSDYVYVLPWFRVCFSLRQTVLLMYRQPGRRAPRDESCRGLEVVGLDSLEFACSIQSLDALWDDDDQRCADQDSGANCGDEP